MRSVAVLCDIHGNLPALDAVLEELRAAPPDAVVLGGDVAAGPMPHEVLERLAALPWPSRWVRGNADRCVVTAYDGEVPEAERDQPMWVADAWTAARLSRAERDGLAALPPLAGLEIEGLGAVLFCHGTPRSDEERVTAVTPVPRLAAILDGVAADLVVGGHTHRQFDLRAGGRRMVNAGSVGRPYEHEPGAYWLRLGPEVDLRCTPYDTEAATVAFRALGYPDADGMLARVDPDKVAAHFEAGAGAPVDPESLTAPG
ncbi:MAG TPA: metallophosphoesterase family protein [Solirubrobacteraceae bacterium]|nr:metallophosphoesterase family protein [Solirubrobacteraceae bacterium]